MIAKSLFIAMTTLSPAAAQSPPPILQITIERIRPGGEAEYGRIEERLKDVCVRMGCPNAYLALETVSTPKEVWWLVMYESHADVERVAAAYAANEPLLKEMTALNALKKDIVDPPIGHMTARCGNESPQWQVGGEPFAVIATGADAAGADAGRADAAGSAVFESDSGARFSIVSAATRAAADAAAARLGARARVFATRPEWSKPDEAWVARNPRLWSR
jgi:hypothetical protein